MSRDRTTRIDDSRSSYISFGIISFVRDFNLFVVSLVYTGSTICGILKLYEESGLRNRNRSEGKKSKKTRISSEHVFMRIRKEISKIYERRKKICKFLLSAE